SMGIPKNGHEPDPSGVQWTLNHNGVNSFIEIPEWQPAGAYEVECDMYSLPFESWKYIYDTHSPRNYVVIDGGSNTLRFDARWVQVFVDGVQIQDKRFTPNGPHHVKVLGIKAGIGRTNRLGGRSSHQTVQSFKGQLTNIKLTDLDNPGNSRFYPMIIRSETMPGATEIEDVLGGHHGQAINFGTESLWVPLLGARE
ncbi:hypothetical protein, partial [Endozoicomonas sp. SESOKO1]|uniref:hypothetical protein n=1 Tax=Endozoicomonas sp. SESOKO1 TaxID=2828742 RepID=UPI002148E261